MVIVAFWISGTLAGVSLFIVLQVMIQRRLALMDQCMQVLTGRAVAWNSLIVLVVHTMLFALAGAYGTLICLGFIGLLFTFNNGFLTYFGRVVTRGDLVNIREAVIFLPSLLRHPRYAVGAVLLSLGIFFAAAGVEDLNLLMAFSDTPLGPT